MKIYGKKLINNYITTVSVQSRVECIATCAKFIGCLSVNIVSNSQESTTYQCELNRAFGSDEAESWIDSPDSLYYSLHIDDCVI